MKSATALLIFLGFQTVQAAVAQESLLELNRRDDVFMNLDDISVDSEQVQFLKHGDPSRKHYVFEGARLILPYNLAKTEAALKVQPLLAQIVIKLWSAEPKHPEDKNCGSSIRPCVADILPVPVEGEVDASSRDFLEELYKTCWFEVSIGQRGHSPHPERHDRILEDCRQEGRGAFEYIADWERFKSAHRGWIDATPLLFSMMNRFIGLKELFVPIRKIEKQPEIIELVKNQAVLPKFMEKLNVARRRIQIATYNLSDSDVIDLLIAKLKQGIPVTVLLDSDFMFREGKLEKLARLAAEGAKIYPSTFPTSLFARSSFHPKAYILDDDVFIGSFNLGGAFGGEEVDESSVHFRSREWAEQMEPVFNYWKFRACSYSLETKAMFGKHCIFQDSCAPILKRFSEECSLRELLRTSSKSFEFGNSDLSVILNGQTALRRLYELFRKAHRKIVIKFPEITYEPLMVYLESLKEERPEVDIELVVAASAGLALHHEKYPNLKFVVKRGALHEKSIAVDDRYQFVTSANLSERGFFSNSEVSVILDLKALTNEQ